MTSAIVKRKREDNGDSLLKEEVEFSRLDTPFPRGGGSELAPIEIRRAAAEATSDVFDDMVKSKKQKRGKPKSQSGPVAPVSRIDPLTFSKIKIGTLILGQIIDIKYATSELLVSLPNNLVGYCPSSILESRQIGRFLRFAVTEVGETPKRHLTLSADPELVNQSLDSSELTNGLAVQGTVESIEEKGLLLNLGPVLGQGFLLVPAKELQNYQVGEAVLAFVKDSEKRIKPMTLDANFATSTVISQPSMMPGTLVKSAPVNKSTPLGTIYDLLGHLTATSDAIHSRSENSAVRVLFSYPPTQINGDRYLGVSKLDHILQLSSQTQGTKVGKIVEGTVSAVMPNLGLTMEFNDAKQNSGFAHISQIEGSADVKLDDNEKYAVGTKHTARVIGYSPLDGVAYLSLDETVINQKYMAIGDVQIGDVVPKAVVDRILPKGGVLIRISKGITGIAAETQLSDAAVRNPELKFKVGQTVAARVLNVDLERERVELTLKKSIVGFDGPVLASYDSLNGQETIGTVNRFIDAGAKILFFGGVRGLLPASQLSDIGAKAEDILRLGQTVKVHVLEADASRDRLVVSTRPKSDLVGHIGEVLSAVVTSRNKSETRVVVLPDLGEANLVAMDDSVKKLKVNDEVRIKVLTDSHVASHPAMIDSAIPTSVDDLEVGQQVVGFVSGTQPNVGIFIGFAAGLVGLVPSNVLGRSKWPAVGKVVSVIVDTVDFARKRVFLSLPSASPTISVTITAVKATQVNVVTADGQQGRIDISQLFKSIEDIADPKKPLAEFKTNQTLDDVHVIGRHDARNHRFLPLSHRSGTHVMLELARYPSGDVSVGQKRLAFINNYSEDGRSLWVTLTPSTRGQLSLVDLSSDPEVLEDPEAHFPVGSALEVTILKVGPKISLTALTTGSKLAQVFSVDPLRLMVRLPHHKTAVINAVDSANEFQRLKSAFKPGQIVEFNHNDGEAASPSSHHITLRTKEHAPVQAGDVRKGFVANIADGGVFVALAPNKIGRVQIGQLSDTYLKNWKTFVRVGDVVDAKVLSVAANSGKIELSLKPSVVTGRKQPNIDKVETGRSYSGTIRRVETFGVFINFKGVTGLCHKSEISDHPIDDLSRVFKVGDSVRVKLLSKDEASGKLSLGMKAKYFENDDEVDSDDDENIEEDIANRDDVSSEEEEDDMEDNDAFASFDNESEAEDDSDEDENEDESADRMSLGNGDLSSSEDEEADSDVDSGNEAADESKALSAGFNWSGDLPAPENEHSGSDFDESDSDDEPRQKSRRKREEFVRDETATIQTRLPQSAKDFERLLVASPNSSILWMNYMAFQLQLGEIDGARDLARRALKTISQREEEERLNIWVALLNLEAQFGTKDSAEKTFREAQQFMDPLTIHMRMGTVYTQAGKIQEARDIYKRAHKRFGGESMEPWLAEMRFYFTEGNNKSTARSLGEQAVQRLPNRLHRDFTRQFALLEFELGDAERGRTLFEALLASAPKRVDIWNVFIDQEIKHGTEEEKIAALFDRVLEQRISMKQAKFFFKKWIGNSSDQEYVKMRAREYVENREQKNSEDASAGESSHDDASD